MIFLTIIPVKTVNIMMPHASSMVISVSMQLFMFRFESRLKNEQNEIHKQFKKSQKSTPFNVLKRL